MKTTNKLTVKLKESYGRPLWYPVDENAHAILAIQGGKTLSLPTMGILEKMGFDIQVETPNWREQSLSDGTLFPNWRER